MFLNKIMDDLVYGDLRQVYLNMDGEMTVGLEYRREIISLISTVLSDMHSSLVLKYGLARVKPSKENTEIFLRSDFVEEGIIENQINDVDNLIQIHRFYTKDSKNNVEEINSDTWNGLARTSNNSFVIGSAEANKEIFVDFQADHPRIDIEAAVHAPESIWIEIPNSLYKALLLGVCARKLGTVGLAQTGSKQGYINYIHQYNNAIQNAKLNGDDLGARFLHTKNFIKDGWV